MGPRKGIPQVADSKFQQWAHFLSRFRYKTEHIKSAVKANCDASSSLPIKVDLDLSDIDTQFSIFYYLYKNIRTLDSKMLAKETLTEKILSTVFLFTQKGWPDLKYLSDELKQYH